MCESHLSWTNLIEYVHEPLSLFLISIEKTKDIINKSLKPLNKVSN